MAMGVSEAISPDEAEERLEAVRTVLRRSVAPEDLRLAQLAFQSDGALLMEGQVANLAAKKRTLRLAIVASGAPGIVDRLHLPAGVPLTDGEIRTQLVDRFVLDPRFKDAAIFEDRDPSPLAEAYAPAGSAAADARACITIEVRDGLVTLNGHMPSLVRKRLAGVLAWRQPGVRDVINGLAVEPPEDDGADRIEEAVREALDGHPLFDDLQIRVGVFKDVVRLTGLVHSRDARQAAEDEAWRVLGVEEVINDIQTSG